MKLLILAQSAIIVRVSDLLASLVYSLIGIAVFCVTFVIVDRLTPYDLWRELIEKQNRALAMVLAGVGLGICIIIAAAIH